MEIKTTKEIRENYIAITCGIIQVLDGAKKWVAVDDKLITEIKKMLLLISAFTKEETDGEVKLNEWRRYFKPLISKGDKE